jgi:multicomponent Na+:H+ antiporter subunit F
MLYITLTKIAIIAIAAGMALVFLGAMFGKNKFERIMCVNCFNSYTIAFIALVASFTKQHYFVDIALIYALVNFITTIGFLKFFKFSKLSYIWGYWLLKIPRFLY